MEKIGIFGGSFNPPHVGHIRAAEYAARKLGLTRVLLIPYGEAPHKPFFADSPTPEQRLHMLRLAAAENPCLEVSDLELTRAGISYTCDTLLELEAQYPGAEFTLLVGSDQFCIVGQWKNADMILKKARLAALCRGEKGEHSRVALAQQALTARGAETCLLDNPVTEISSTQLRRLLAFGCGDAFLHPAVADYIRQRGLYDTAANWRMLPMEELEPIVIRLLDPSRVRHVLGCRDTCVALAKRWGADETDAARAGLLHDITKALDGPLQLTLCGAYGKILDDFSRKYPKTLHALTGSLVAERIFGENAAVVSAICSHTTGKANMNTLEAIVYVADYMEPNRDFPGVERLRDLAFSDLRAALKLGLEMTLEHLKNQGSEVSGQSIEALHYLNTSSERRDHHVNSKRNCL